MSYTLALTRKIASKSSNLLDTFMEMDVSATGTISRSDLAISIKQLFNIVLTKRQLNSLATQFGISGSSHVRYSEFVATIRDMATAQPLTSSSYGAGDTLQRGGDWNDETFTRLGIVRVPESVTVEELMRVIARKIRSRSATSGSATQTFLAMDEDRDGSITVTEFCEFFKNIGLDVPFAKATELLEDYLAPDNTVRMASFCKFLKSLQPSREVMPWEKLDDETAKRERIVAQSLARQAKAAIESAITRCVDDAQSDEKILEALGDTLLYKKMTLVRAFKKFDTDREGGVSKEEFTKGLRDCGLDVSEERVGALVSRFDVSKNGRLACWEFIRMMAGGGEEEEEEAKEQEQEEVEVALPGTLVADADEDDGLQAKIASGLELDESEILLKFKQTLLEEKRKLRMTFKRIAEGGRSINAEQLLKGLEELGCKIDEASAKRIVEKADCEGTGELQFYEFLRMMNNINV